METISKDLCLPIGFFQKPHGVFGTLLLNFEEGLEEAIEESKMFLVETDGILVPWFTPEDGVRITSTRTALVDLEWVDDENSARKLSGKQVWMEKNLLSDDNLPDQNSFWIGFRVNDIHKGFLGLVTEVNDYAGNLVLTLSRGDSTLLIPFHPDLVSHLDEQSGEITFELPDGLTDV
jgi:16S rRNA processing protein RimM